MTKSRLRRKNIIATREYTLVGGDERVIINLGCPYRSPTTGMYHCVAEVRECGRTWVRSLVGKDAFEAVQLALIVLGTDINHIQQQLNGQLIWTKDQTGGLGIPTFPDFSLRPIIEPSGDR